MRKKRSFVTTCLTALLVVVFPVLLGPPAAVQAAPTALAWYTLDVYFSRMPPNPMCLGDKAVLAMPYDVLRSSGPGTPTGSPTSGAKGSVTAKATGGTLTTSEWPISSTTGEGLLMTYFTATKAGAAKVSLSGGGNFSITGVPSIDFDVINCKWSIDILYTGSFSAADVDLYAKFRAHGGMTANHGLLEGGGTHLFSLDVFYSPADLTCETLQAATDFNTFSVSGTAPSDGSLKFTLYFMKLQTTPLVLSCLDTRGKKIKKTILESMPLDVNAEIPQEWAFAPRETMQTFTFKTGKGEGTFYLTKRKGGSK